MIITHNMGAMFVLNQRAMVHTEKGKNMERLSSGYKINRAADDAAALTISSNMRWQIRGLNRAAQNVQEGVSLIQVADGALTEVHDMLQRMNELSVQAASDTNTDDDRDALQKEVDKLASEITRIGKTTHYNGLYLFDKLRPGDPEVTNIADLVKCASAEAGYLKEAYHSTSTNKWYSAAKLDFSNINSGNISKLYDKSFSFNCSQNCNEAFKFTFINGNGNSDSATNLHGAVQHQYKIDINGMTSGSQIVDKMWDYIQNHMPTGTTTSSTAGLDGGIFVSHSNVLIKTSSNELWVVGTAYQNSEAAAKNAFPRKNIPKSGAIDATEIVKASDENDLRNLITIQTGCVRPDHIDIYVDRMNANLLGVDNLKLWDYNSAGSAIEKVQKAIAKVSAQRSMLGAEQNRLADILNIDQNTSENTQSAESKMRDTDYADTTVKLMRTKTLEDVSVEMLRNSKESAQGVLLMFA
ncbi:MAG: hypothetical protein NC086_02895 [Alistipes sp.]|nr:hypothetical protein [Alistipes sp.]